MREAGDGEVKDGREKGEEGMLIKLRKAASGRGPKPNPTRGSQFPDAQTPASN